MEKKKLGAFIADAGNAAKGAFGKAKGKTIQLVDQNNDGNFDMADVSIVMGSVGDNVKRGAVAIKESAEENRRRIELKVYRPIFTETLDDADFTLSKLIRIVERDKRHAESDVCQGSIGYLSDKGDLRIVNLFRDSVDAFGLNFYPDADCDFYYVNPSDRDSYISLDEYFSYLKTVRINELQRVAQTLGAKHFKVTYKEECTSYSRVNGNAQGGVMRKKEVEVDYDASAKKYSMIDVAAEMHMDGHAPQEPQLIYLSKDESIRTLVQLRMTGGEGFRNHKISIKMSNSSGIKESDGVKIDTVLNGLKVSGNATVASEARNESRRYLEYEIDF